MRRDNLKSGVVVRVGFPWGTQQRRGEAEGRKQRPALIGFRLDDDLVLLFPITTKEPEKGRCARALPETEKAAPDWTATFAVGSSSTKWTPIPCLARVVSSRDARSVNSSRAFYLPLSRQPAVRFEKWRARREYSLP